MKANEIKPCAICGKPLCTLGVPVFYRIRVEQMVVDVKAVQQIAGLAMMFGGNLGLARVMGPDPNVANPIGDPVTSLVCQTCALTPNIVAQLAEER